MPRSSLLLGLLLASGCSGPAIVSWDAGRGYACTVDKRGQLACHPLDTSPSPYISEELPQEGRWSQVSVGGSHACALDREGYPTCWGKIIWTDVAGLLPREKLSVLESGASTSCGLRQSDGSMVCLNPVEGTEDAVVLDVPAGSFKRLDVLEGLVCYERISGEVGCQGVYPSTGLVFSNPPVGVYNPVEMNAYGMNICVTDEAGQISCWGRDTYGILSPPSGTGYHSLALGQKHACALNAQDEAVCWGNYNEMGSLDAPSGTFEALISGSYYTCGRRPGGDMECWGCSEETIHETDTKRLSRDYCVW